MKITKESIENYNDPDYIKDLLKNKEKFLKEIYISGGFVLTFFKKHNVKPDIKILIELICPAVIYYIKTEYDFDNLDFKYKEKINKFLMKDDEIEVKQKTETKITKKNENLLIKQMKKLPLNTRLDVEQINKYTEELLKQIKIIRDGEEEGYNGDNNELEVVLRESFKQFDIKSFMGINEKFLFENPEFFFNINKNLFKYKEYNFLYKKLMIEKYRNKKKKLDINKFKNYFFNDSDKKFFYRLVLNRAKERIYRDFKYSSIENIYGAEKFLNKFKFFEKVSIDEISNFTNKEVEENLYWIKSVIQKKILKNYFYNKKDKNLTYFGCYDLLFTKDISSSIFEKIIDENFICETFNQTNDDDEIEFLTKNMDYENKESVIKIVHLVSVIIDAVDAGKINIKDETFFALIDYLRKSTGSTYLGKINYETKEKLKNILKKYINDNIKNEKCTLLFDEYKNLFDEHLLGEDKNNDENFYLEMIGKNYNVNSVYLLFKMLNESMKDSDFRNQKEVKIFETIKVIIKNINDENGLDSIKKIINYFGLEYFDLNKERSTLKHNFIQKEFLDLDKKIKVKIDVLNDNKSKKSDNQLKVTVKINNKNIEENFLYYSNMEKNINNNLLNLIYSIKPEVLNHILRCKIIVEDKFLFSLLDMVNGFYKKNEIRIDYLKNEISKNSELNNKIENKELLILIEAETKYFDIIKFLKKYIKENYENIKNNTKLYSEIIKSVKQKEIIDLPKTENILFDNYIAYINKTDECSRKIKEIANIMESRKINFSRIKEKVKKEIGTENQKNNDHNINNEDIIDYTIDEIPKDEIIKNVDFLESKDFEKILKNIFYKIKTLENKTKILYEKLSSSMVDEKIDELLKSKNFKEILKIIYFSKMELSNKICKYINNCSFEELYINLDDISFHKLLRDMVGYNKKTKIKFADFTDEQNTLLSKKLFNIFNNPLRDSVNLNNDFLYFFNEKNNSFIKKFAIEYFPHKIFYSYDFLPNYNTYRPTNFIKTDYSFDEIYEIFKNSNSNSNFFEAKDVNASFFQFFDYNFFNGNKNKIAKNENEKKVTKFIDFINYIKKKDLRLYALMFSYNILKNEIINNYYSEEESEKACCLFCKEHFDLKEVFAGYSLIFEDLTEFENKRKIKYIKNHEKNITKTKNNKTIQVTNNTQDVEQDVDREINYDLLRKALNSFLFATYYEEKTGNTFGNFKNKSLFSDKETEEIIKFIFEVSPNHFYENSTIGNTNNISEIFKNNNSFLENGLIFKFVTPEFDFFGRYSSKHQKFNLKLEECLKALIGMNLVSDNNDCKKNNLNNVADYLNYFTGFYKFMFDKINRYKAIKYNEFELKYGFYECINWNVIEFIEQNDEIKNLLKNINTKIELSNKLQKTDKITEIKKRIYI